MHAPGSETRDVASVLSHLRELVNWLSTSWRLRVAAGAYCVVLIFAIVFMALNYVEGRIGGAVVWLSLSRSEVLFAAFLVTAPLILALIWERLTTLKLGIVEVSLSQVSVGAATEVSVAADLFAQRLTGSEAPNLVHQLELAIGSSTAQVLEVNLRGGNYWWSTRLYLLAALAEDFSNVRQIVFVADGASRKYKGMAAPASIRRTLERSFPALRDRYATIRSGTHQLSQIVFVWTSQTFSEGENSKTEEQATKIVSWPGIEVWFEEAAETLDTDYVKWRSDLKWRSLYAEVIDRPGQLIAVVRHGRLERIVDRSKVVQRLARIALGL